MTKKNGLMRSTPALPDQETDIHEFEPRPKGLPRVAAGFDAENREILVSIKLTGDASTVVRPLGY